MAGKIGILEIFGPTIQGEGMVAGQKTIFVRTYGCDYRCSWCDSKFTWDGSQKPRMLTPTEICEEIEKLEGGCKHVTISGGNPALYGKAMEELINHLHEMDFRVGLETQGSKWQDWFIHVDDLTFSPKPPSSGMTLDEFTFYEIINKCRATEVNYSIKVVVFDEKDWKWMKRLHNHFPSPSHPWFLQVGNEDQTEDGDISSRLLAKYEWLCNKVIADKDLNWVRPLPQLHTLIWGNKQGV